MIPANSMSVNTEDSIDCSGDDYSTVLQRIEILEQKTDSYQVWINTLYGLFTVVIVILTFVLVSIIVVLRKIMKQHSKWEGKENFSIARPHVKPNVNTISFLDRK